VSFHLAANHYIDHLVQSGIDVRPHDLHFSLNGLHPQDATEIAIVHPIFYRSAWEGVSFEQIIERLRDCHETVIGMEVADTSLISERFASWASHPLLAGLALPSAFSIGAFRRAGITKRIGYVPHGVTTVRPSTRFAFLQKDRRPKILVFAVGDARRKGVDLVSRLLPEFSDCLFVLKIPTDATFRTHLDNIVAINEWLPEVDLASLYCSCDLLLSLHRAGAFELNCLEAAAYGLPIVTPGYGCVLEYLTQENTCFVGVERIERLRHDSRSDHCGIGATADLTDTKNQLRRLLADLASVRKRALNCQDTIRTNWSWQRAADKLVDFAEQCTAM